MGIITELETFVRDHRPCGNLVGDAEEPTEDGYRIWLQRQCGARLERWVTAPDAEGDLYRAALLTSPN